MRGAILGVAHAGPMVARVAVAASLWMVACGLEPTVSGAWDPERKAIVVTARAEPGTRVEARVRSSPARGECTTDGQGRCELEVEGAVEGLTAAVAIHVNGDFDALTTLSVPLPLVYRYQDGMMQAHGTECVFAVHGSRLHHRECPEGTAVQVGAAHATGATGSIQLPGPVVLRPGVDLATPFSERSVPLRLPITAHVALPREGADSVRWEGQLVMGSIDARDQLAREALARVGRGWEAQPGAAGVLAVADDGGHFGRMRRYGVQQLGDVKEIVRLRPEWRDARSCGSYLVRSTGPDGATSQSVERSSRRARDIVAEAFAADGSLAATERIRGELPACPDSTHRTGLLPNLRFDGSAPWDDAWAWAAGRIGTTEAAGGARPAPDQRRRRSVMARPSEPPAVSDGRLSPSVVRSVVGRQGGAMRRCYQRGRDPSLAGRVTLRWRVDPSGGVRDVRVGADTLGSPVVSSCMVRAVSSLRFPSSANGGEVRHPFEFRPG